MTSTQPAPTAGNDWRRRLPWLAAGLLTIVIAYFHISFVLQAGGFWRDEVNLINLSHSHSLEEMKRDSFPVLMPLLVRAWTVLGLAGSDLSLRILGTLIGLGVPAALWLAAWQARHSPPWLGLALFGLNTTLIVFGDSLRAYGLGSLLIMLTAIAAVALLRKPSWTRTLWLAVAATLSVQTLFHNAILTGAICLAAMLVGLRKKKWLVIVQIFLAGLVAALSLMPYVAGMVAGQQGAVVIRSGLKSWRFFAAFEDALGFPRGEYVYVWSALALLLIVLAVAVFFRGQKEVTAVPVDEGDLRLFAGLTVLLGFAGYVLFLWLAAFPSQSWYLLPLLALAAVCFETGLPTAVGTKRILSSALIVVTICFAVSAANRDLHYRFTNVDAWARGLQAQAAPEDYIIVVPWFCGLTFDHYFKGPTPWTTVPPLADHATHRYDLVREQVQNTNAIQPLFGHIVSALQSGHKVWILAGPGLMEVPEAGTAAPASLPPAPLEKTGWSEAPYTMVWDSQIGHWLADHAQQFGRVKNPAASQQIIENTELFEAEGWTNAAPRTP